MNVQASQQQMNLKLLRVRVGLSDEKYDTQERSILYRALKQYVENLTPEELNALTPYQAFACYREEDALKRLKEAERNYVFQRVSRILTVNHAEEIADLFDEEEDVEKTEKRLKQALNMTVDSETLTDENAYTTFLQAYKMCKEQPEEEE